MTSRLVSVSVAVIAWVSLLAGCESKQQQSGPSSGAASKPEVTSPTAPTTAAVPASPAAGHSGEVIELGETTVDGMGVRAARDKGEIRPGGDAPIDIWIDGGLGGAAAVRFWIGTEDAKGAVKAKAGVEAGHWHTHAEVPDPLPTESRLWVEIEGKNGQKSLVSFDLLRK